MNTEALGVGVGVELDNVLVPLIELLEYRVLGVGVCVGERVGVANGVGVIAETRSRKNEKINISDF
jgi:hypothetical protein